MSLTERGYFIDTSANVACEINFFDGSAKVDEIINSFDDDHSSIETDATSMKDDVLRKDKVRIPKCIISSRKGIAIKLMSIDEQHEMLLDE